MNESQAPFVFAAAADFDKLPEWHTICKSPRSQFSKKQVNEFEKTAFKISQSPWNLSMGSAYLLKLVTENQENDGQDWNPPLLIFLFHGIGPKPAAGVVKIEDPKFDENTFLWNHTTPGQVTVTRARPRLSQKMPAAAPLATGNPASASRPAASPMSGAPASLFGRDGAPARQAAAPANKALKRPASVLEAAPPSPQDGDAEALSEKHSEHSLPSDVGPAEDAALPSAHETDTEGPALAEPKAKAKAKAKGKAKAKAKATGTPKAAAKPEAAAKQKRPQFGRLPKPDGVKIGCSKCNYSKTSGCAQCRKRAGLILNEEQTAWIYK